MAALVAAVTPIGVMAGVAAADNGTGYADQSVVQQGYSTPITTSGIGGTQTSPGGTNNVKTNGAAGVKKTISSVAPLRTAKKTGTLPFTGAQLTIFGLVGMALIAGGFLLRTTGRRRGSDT